MNLKIIILFLIKSIMQYFNYNSSFNKLILVIVVVVNKLLLLFRIPFYFKLTNIININTNDLILLIYNNVKYNVSYFSSLSSSSSSSSNLLSIKLFNVTSSFNTISNALSNVSFYLTSISSSKNLKFYFNYFFFFFSSSFFLSTSSLDLFKQTATNFLNLLYSNCQIILDHHHSYSFLNSKLPNLKFLISLFFKKKQFQQQFFSNTTNSIITKCKKIQFLYKTTNPFNYLLTILILFNLSVICESKKDIIYCWFLSFIW